MGKKTRLVIFVVNVTKGVYSDSTTEQVGLI